MRLAMRARAGCITYNCSVAHPLVRHGWLATLYLVTTPTREELTLAIKSIAIRQDRLLHAGNFPLFTLPTSKAKQIMLFIGE